MEDAYRKIEAVLKEVAGKRRAILAARSALTGCAILLAALIAGIALAPRLSGMPWLILRAAALAGMAASFITAAVLYHRGRENEDETALAIERANPRLNDALISSVQLKRAENDPGPAGSFSAELLNTHIEKTAAGIDDLDLSAVLSKEALRIPAAASAILAVALAAMAALAPGYAAKGLAKMFSELREVKKDSAKQAALPLTTGDFTVRYRFPAYSGIETQTVHHTNGDIAALKGTLVKLETVVLESLKSASLVTSAGARYAMRVEEGGRLSAELILSEPGAYYIEGEGADGNKYAEPGSHRLVVDEDLAPSAVMLMPVEDVEVAGEGSLFVSFQADDDFGLSKVELVYERSGEEHAIEIRNIKRERKKTVEGDYEWDLSKMGFRPGERIPFRIQVTDNDEVSGGNVGRSELRVLTIFSARKFHRQLLDRQDELLNMMIDHLASHLEALLDDKDKYGKALKHSEMTLLDEGRRLVEAIDALLKDMEEDEYKEVLAQEALYDMRTRYAFLLDDRHYMVEGEKIPAGPEIEKLLSLREDYRTGLEADILYLDRLIKKQRIEDIMAESEELYQVQADLASLLAEYKRTGNPELLEELRQALAELQSAFESLMRRMAKMRKSLPEEFVNADALDKQKVTDLAAEMERLRQAMVDGDMESVMEMAEDLLADMGQWMAGLEEGADEFSDMISREIMQGIDEVDRRLEDLINREQMIEEALSEMYQKALEKSVDSERVQELKKELEKNLEEFQQSLLETQRSFFRMQPGAMEGRAKPLGHDLHQERYRTAAPLHNLRWSASTIRDSLEEGDLQGALDMAAELDEKLQDTLDVMDSFAKEHKAGPPSRRQEYNESAEKTRQSMEEIKQGLEKLRQGLSTAVSPSQKSELENLGQVQEALRQDLQSLMDRYGELRQEAPSLPGEVTEHLDNASLKMYDASGEMMLGEPGSAMAPARDARARMEKARGALNKAREKMGQSMGGMGLGMSMRAGGSRSRGNDGGRGLDTDGEVDIPDEDQYTVPEEYREQILKAMKEDSPDAYKNLNRDYYERLVK